MHAASCYICLYKVYIANKVLIPQLVLYIKNLIMQVVSCHVMQCYFLFVHYMPSTTPILILLIAQSVLLADQKYL